MDELTRVLWEYASSYRLEAFYIGSFVSQKPVTFER